MLYRGCGLLNLAFCAPNGRVCVCNVACQQAAMQKMCATLAVQVLCSRHQPHLSCLWQIHSISEGSLQWCLESSGQPFHLQAAASFSVLPGLLCLRLLLLRPNLETIWRQSAFVTACCLKSLLTPICFANELGNNSLLFLQG